MWLYASGADSLAGNIPDTGIPNIVLYDYHNSRAGQCAVNFLNGYDGYLQVDGYRIESQLKDKRVEERYLSRQEKSQPLLNQLHTWLEKSVQQVLSKTKLG